jgi:RND superfamily putative drug exporter
MMKETERMGKKPSLLFERWPRFATRHPWRVFLGGLGVIIILVVIARSMGGELVDSFSIPGTESQEVIDLLEERFPRQSGGSATVVVYAPDGLETPETRQRVEALTADLRDLPEVVEVADPYDQRGSMSDDRTIARISTQYARQSFEIDSNSLDALVDLREESDADGFQVELGGPVASAIEQEPPGTSEIIGVIAAAIILLIAFGSVVAMGLPILTALMGLVPGFMLATILAAFVDMPSFTTQFSAMIGIGVGIDYSLLIVNRFRESIHNGKSVEDSVVMASATAGRSVLFAGSVVIIALMGLWAVGIPFVAFLGTAAALLVGCTALIAVFLLPAMLMLVGRGMDRWTLPGLSTRNTVREDSLTMRWARSIQRRPAIFLVAGLAVAALIASPSLGMRLGSSDAGNNPESSTTRRAYDLLAQGFGLGFNGQVLVAVAIDTPEAVPAVEDLPSIIRKVDGVSTVSPVIFNRDSTAAIVSVFPEFAPQDPETDALVEELRAVLPEELRGSGATPLVGGQTAAFIDIADKISQSLPLFLFLVVGLSMVLLAMVFRSILIPIKAALMTLVSLGVAFGVIVAVFQWGWLSGVLGTGGEGPVESFLPMMLFAILFGLSTDYEVFLITRIHEEHQRTRRNGEAVARGQGVTMRVILAAAAIMGAVFLSFVLGDQRVIKEFGLGLGIAILADALLVRMVLVPSIMHLFGDWNWWFPAWLDRLLPRFHVEPEPEELLAPAGYGAIAGGALGSEPAAADEGDGA